MPILPRNSAARLILIAQLMVGLLVPLQLTPVTLPH